MFDSVDRINCNFYVYSVYVSHLTVPNRTRKFKLKIDEHMGFRAMWMYMHKSNANVSLMSCVQFYIVYITEYRVWWRDDSQAEIDEIPYIGYSDHKYLTLNELVTAIQGNTVTHMSIYGDIPPQLHSIAPHLKHLRLKEPPYSDQSER